MSVINAVRPLYVEVVFKCMKELTLERNYECNQCCKAFAHRSLLQKHERSHSGEKPYECNQCGKAFASRSSLRNHEKHHNIEKPNEYNQCAKVFTSLPPSSNI